MNHTAQELADEYQGAIEAFLAERGEAALERAYELGRRAMARGMGVLEIAAIHEEALSRVSCGAAAVEDCTRRAEQAARFLAETLSPYEMTFRGFQEALAELRTLNQTLEQRVADRTAEAERARRAAETAERRARFLAEASRILASSLAYEETIQTVARLAVPQVADWCAIDLLEDGRIRRVAAAHVDSAKEELAREYVRRYPPDPDAPTALARVLRTGEPELLLEMPESLLRQEARDAEQLRMLKDMAFVSAMVVPLIARGRTLGAVTFAAAESGRRYGPEDVFFAEDLAGRLAVAVDNARLYEEALAASQAKTDFLAVMSHELRTPLNAILGYADLLLMGVPHPLPEDSLKQVERIVASARHLLELIEEILSFSRMEAGREEVHLERVDLGALVRETGALLEPLAEEKGLGFEIHTPDEPLPVETDPGKVRQILLNLLSNAVKFTDEGGIELSARVENGWQVIQVRDTGIGIPREYQEKIFDAFFQLEKALTRERIGTGLGLAVSARLARLLGGEISVESEPGRGSTFTVRLPARAGHPSG